MDFREIFYANGTLQWQPILVAVFAVAFFITGFLRIVEFQSIAKPLTRKLLIALHCIGVLFFSSALFIGMATSSKEIRALSFGLFIGAMVLFAPGQFLIGMARKKALESKMISEGKEIVYRKPLLFKLFKKNK